MTESRKGELLNLGGVILWAFFPVITVLSYSSLPALISLAWSSLIAGVFFGVIIAYRDVWHELRNVAFWKYVSGVIFFIGVIYYVLLFAGLEHTTPGNVAIIALSEVLFSFLFFNVVRGEVSSRGHVIGAILVLLGALIVVGKDFSGLNIGDVFVLAASATAPVGNLFQREARMIASSETIMFVRSIASAVIVFILAAIVGKHATSADVHASIWFLIINGVLLFGLAKFLWIEAIHRISVTKANALGAVGPLVTLCIAWMILGQTPDVWQLGAFVPMFFGVLLLTDQFPVQYKHDKDRR